MTLKELEEGVPAFWSVQLPQVGSSAVPLTIPWYFLPRLFFFLHTLSLHLSTLGLWRGWGLSVVEERRSVGFCVVILNSE